MSSAKFIARKGDKVTCPTHGAGEIIDGCATVLVEGSPAARVGDRVQFQDGAIDTIADNNCVLVIDGRKVARLGDATTSGGIITTAATSTTAADA